MHPADIDAAVATIHAQLPEVSAIYLYGSQARGDARPDSDVDFAVLTNGPRLPPMRLWDLRMDLAADLRRPVDLVQLDTVSTILQREVIADGARLYAAAPIVADLFEVQVLREYADLKTRRHGIEADIVARGRVLGHV